MRTKIRPVKEKRLKLTEKESATLMAAPLKMTFADRVFEQLCSSEQTTYEVSK